MSYYGRRGRWNKWGVTLSLPYLIVMGISFDMLFFGSKYFSNYAEDLKIPVNFQIEILNSIGVGQFLSKYLSFFQSYILITTVVGVGLYQLGKFIDKKLSNY